MPSNRPLKVADRIKEVLATALENHVKDPRLGFITLTDVRVTGDLQHASIFYTVLGDETASEATAAALNSAKGMLRSEVGKALGLRIVPTLEFIPDALDKTASAMNDLISQMRERDEELARLRQGAKPVGDSDPYKHHE